MKQATKKRGKQRKIETVEGLKEKLASAKAFFLTDYRGLTHPQLEQLRKALKKVQAEFLVAKNTLVKMAINSKEGKINQEQIKKIEEELNNPTAAFFAFGDEIAAIRELAKFIKGRELPKIKIGFFAGELSSAADFVKLSVIPSREQLLAMLVGGLKSPIYGLHYALSWNLRKLVTVLNNVKSKKPAS